MPRLTFMAATLCGIVLFVAGPCLHFAGTSKSWGYLQHGLAVLGQLVGAVIVVQAFRDI